MNNKILGSLWVRRIVFTAIIAEILYLVLFNLALQLPVTQTLINKARPEKVHISWENAWTWYPFRFHIRNAAGNGQSRSQQWEFRVRSVSASIDVLPLLFRRVWIDNVQVSDADYYQRPRLKPDKDYSQVTEFFPPISGREITDAVTTPKKDKKPWHVDIQDVTLDGQFSYWVHQFKGQVRGTLQAEIDVVSRGGLLSMTVPVIELELDPHYINNAEMFRRGKLSGEVGLAPFLPRENRGMKLLQYLSLDANVDLDLNSLAFINTFTRNFEAMKMDGTGKVAGRLRMEHGRMLGGTDITVDADDLQVHLYSHLINGGGAVSIKVGPETNDQLDMDVSFEDMAMSHAGGGTPLFAGLGLRLNFRTAGDLFQAASDNKGFGGLGSENRNKPFELAVIIPDAQTADMSVFNYYLPPSSPFRFASGSADLTADFLLKQDDAKGFLRLSAKEMQAEIDNQSIQTDFSADISLVDGVPGEGMFDIAGTEFRFDNVRVVGDNENFNRKNWATAITLTQADMVFTAPVSLKTKAELSMTDSRPIVAMLGNRNDSPDWVKNMLTIEDLTGIVELDMTGSTILIPDAFINSEKVDFGAKGIIHDGLNDGVIYARYKKLDIVVKISEGKKNTDLIRARDKFDEYQLPGANDGGHGKDIQGQH